MTARWARSGWPAPPIGFLLRSACPDNWLRIHFFADKRYPETEADDAQVADRFRTCGDQLFESGEDLDLYRYRFVPDPEDPFDSLPKAEWVRGCSWQPVDLQQDLKATAHDQEGSFLLHSPRSGNAMAPYPGGIDLFLKEAGQKEALAATLAEWRSAREDGL